MLQPQTNGWFALYRRALPPALQNPLGAARAAGGFGGTGLKIFFAPAVDGAAPARIGATAVTGK
jgi:hypothetical protein